MRNKESKTIKDKISKELIEELCKKHNYKIGIRQIAMKLNMNTKKIARIKREYNIPTKIRRKRPYQVTLNKDLNGRVAPNIIGQRFKVKAVDKVYSTDITYLYYGGGLAYLSTTKDLCNREIVAYNLSKTLQIETGYKSIETMLKNKKPENLIIHSDQGVHYTHSMYVNTLAKYEVIQSMSRKGVCLDNAPIESFFGHMKDELDLKQIKTYENLKETIDKYMEYYNNERQQWTLKKMSPVQYRKHLLDTA